MVRVALGLLGLAWAAQFFVFRAWWTQHLAAINWSDAPQWFPRVAPYVFAVVGLVWGIAMLATGFGVY